MKKLFQIYLWKLFKILPPSLRGYFSRALFRIQIKDAPDSLKKVKYELAESIEDINAALTLLQKNYLRLKMSKDDSELRISKFNLLPSTYTFIAKYEGEVIATISVILDSSLNLPVDEYCDVSNYREDGMICAEISSLTVKDEWRSRSMGLFFVLSTYCHKYAVDNLGVDYFFISIRNKVRNFYEDILLFKPLSKPRKYEGVNNLKSISMYLETEGYSARLKKVYGNRPIHKNAYEIYQNYPWISQCDFSKKYYGLLSRKLMSKNEIEFLFKKQSNVLACLNPIELSKVNNFYFGSSALKDNIDNVISLHASRENQRYLVKQKVTIIKDDMEFVGRVQDVSRSGFSAIFNHDMKGVEDSFLSAIVEIDSDRKIFVSLSVKIKWEKNKRIGFYIQDTHSQKWFDMISYFEGEIMPNEDEVKKVA